MERWYKREAERAMSECVRQVLFRFFAEFHLLFAEDGSCNGTWAFGSWPLKHKLEEEHGLITALSGALINHPTRPPVIVLRETIREWKHKNQYCRTDTKFSTFYEIFSTFYETFSQPSPDHDFPQALRAADSAFTQEASKTSEPSLWIRVRIPTGGGREQQLGLRELCHPGNLDPETAVRKRQALDLSGIQQMIV